MTLKLLILIALSIIISIAIVRICLYISLMGIEFMSSAFKKEKPKPIYKPTDEVLLRDRGKEKKQQKEAVEDFGFDEIEEEEIVEIAKPIGYWTSFVVGKNLSRMMAQRRGLWADQVKNNSERGRNGLQR